MKLYVESKKLNMEERKASNEIEYIVSNRTEIKEKNKRNTFHLNQSANYEMKFI